jgi:hypothetical protein
MSEVLMTKKMIQMNPPENKEPEVMKMFPVDSSNISSIGYRNITENDETKETLVVIVNFKNGNTYEVYDIKMEVFDEFLSSHSKGRFFNNYIRGLYEIVKV